MLSLRLVVVEVICVWCTASACWRMYAGNGRQACYWSCSHDRVIVSLDYYNALQDATSSLEPGEHVNHLITPLACVQCRWHLSFASANIHVFQLSVDQSAITLEHSAHASCTNRALCIQRQRLQLYGLTQLRIDCANSLLYSIITWIQHLLITASSEYIRQTQKYVVLESVVQNNQEFL